jgi:membrane protein
VPKTSPDLYLVPAGAWAQFWGLLRRAFVAAYEDNCFGVAKGAAYSSLLAFFPVLTSITAILVQANAEAVSKTLSDLLFEVVPPGSEQLLEYEFKVRGQRPVWLIVVAAMLSIWAASGAMLSLMEGFQAAYRIPSGRPFLKQRGVAVLLVLIVALPSVFASLLILFGARTERYLIGWAGYGADMGDVRQSVFIIGRLVRYGIALVTIVCVAALLYFVGPNRRMKLRSVWPGAMLSTVLWLLATMGFAWYVRNIANYNLMYGSIGAVIVLLIWMYLLAIIALYGCEFNAERERLIPD